jgi:hypothetical protein
MLRIKRVPTVVSNYQKDESEEAARREGGCGRNCLNKCCIQGICCIAFACQLINYLFIFSVSIGFELICLWVSCEMRMEFWVYFCAFCFGMGL